MSKQGSINVDDMPEAVRKEFQAYVSKPKLTREMLLKMTPEGLAEQNWGEVREALSEWIAEVACNRCKLPYTDTGFADFVVPDDVWKQISPTGHEGGILCVTCMFRRMHVLGIENVDGAFTSGPCANHEWKKPIQPNASEELCDQCGHEKSRHRRDCSQCYGFVHRPASDKPEPSDIEAAEDLARKYLAGTAYSDLDKEEFLIPIMGAFLAEKTPGIRADAVNEFIIRIGKDSYYERGYFKLAMKRVAQEMEAE